MSPSTAKMRLDRLLANLGYGARRDIKALAKAGRITLDGAPVRDGDAQIALAADLPARLLIDRVPLDPLPGLVLAMHKPLGITCSHKDQGPLVYDLLPARWRRRTPPLSTIGRLDKDTSGLLLLTDDGLLLHRAIAPRSKVTKRYRVTLARPLEGHEADGGSLPSGPTHVRGPRQPRDRAPPRSLRRPRLAARPRPRRVPGRDPGRDR